MDSLTQAALGASIGEALLGRKIGRNGMFLGTIIATIPDLDIVILPFLNRLDRLSMHRGYSHSILFSILGALLIAIILTRIKWGKDISYIRLLVFSWLCLFTHMILDTFTPYGTLLFVPFTDNRVGFDSINIVDVFYTLPLLIGLNIGSKYRESSTIKSSANIIGLSISSIYLFGTLGVKSMVDLHFEKQLNDDGIIYQKLLSEPVGMGSVHWYGVARSEEGIYIGDYSFWSKNDIQFTYFPTNDSLLHSVDKHLVERMKWFAKDFYHVKEDKGEIFF